MYAVHSYIYMSVYTHTPAYPKSSLVTFDISYTQSVHKFVDSCTKQQRKSLAAFCLSVCLYVHLKQLCSG